MLHTTGYAGNQPKRQRGKRRTWKLQQKTQKVTFTNDEVRKLMLEFLKDYKSVCSSKNFSIETPIEHRWKDGLSLTI